MKCPKCQQHIDHGAAFCGNCGYQLHHIDKDSEPISKSFARHEAHQRHQDSLLAVASLPAYTLSSPVRRAGETKATLSLVLGTIGVIGNYKMALLGLVFGIAGIVLGTMSRQSVKKGVSTAGIIVSSLAVLLGLAVWAYNISQDPRLHQSQTSTKGAQHTLPTDFVAATSLSTPCYSAGFTTKLNIRNSTGSCDMAAFNGADMENSSDLYRVYAETISSEENFVSIIKPAIEKDIHTTLSGFVIKSEKASQFASSTAYTVDAVNSASDVEVVESAVYHQTKNGANVFILVHAVAGGDSANLNSLEAQWQWK